jgi:2-polyprenyl-3-methyl-5-hydroxy-6-metoxy-1,4-benzoquinol methylase
VQCINAQYDSEASMEFYKHAMGGGTDYVHYGVFNSDEDDLATACHNTVVLLSELARRCAPHTCNTIFCWQSSIRLDQSISPQCNFCANGLTLVASELLWLYASLAMAAYWRSCMCRCSAVGLGLKSTVKVLDLGSGKGAAARHLASAFGCHVTCFNLGRNQNEYNAAAAREAGVGHLVSCVLGNFNEPLPAEWTASFDVVWSQEV